MNQAEAPVGAAIIQSEEGYLGHTLIALVICGVPALVLAVLLRAAGSGLFAEAAALVCFAFHPTVAHSLERKEITFSSKLYAPWLAFAASLATFRATGPSALRSLYRDREPPWLAIVITTGVLFTIVDLAVGLVLGFGLGLAGYTTLPTFFYLVILALNCYIAYRVGAWIGASVRSNLYAVTLAAVFFAQVLGQAVNGLTGVEAPGVAIGAAIFGSIIWSIPACFGAWRGQKRLQAMPIAASALAAPPVKNGPTSTEPSISTDSPTEAAFEPVPVVTPSTVETTVSTERVADESPAEKAPSELRCLVCNTLATPRAKFCLHCGTPLAEAAPSAAS